jgi:ParB family chromosome partitioning protein
MKAGNKVELVPIAKIHVINARARSRTKFQEIIESIAKLGTKQPVIVARRDDDDYDLICGQGRLEANQELGQTEVPAIVIEASVEDRYLMSLVENIARRAPTTVEMAREITALKERGYKVGEIAEKVGLSTTYVSGMLRLLENGEERLVDAVERRELPINIAMQIATVDDATMQKNLAKAYGSGLNGRKLLVVRRILERRTTLGKTLRSRGGSARGKTPTPEELVRTYEKEANRRQAFVTKSRFCEDEVRFVVNALKDLFADKVFVDLLEAENLADLPKNLAEAMHRS